jgi:hypothetical protein
MIKKLNLKNYIKYSVFNTKALSSKQGFENTEALSSQAHHNTQGGSDKRLRSEKYNLKKLNHT